MGEVKYVPSSKISLMSNLYVCVVGVGGGVKQPNIDEIHHLYSVGAVVYF